VPRRYTEQQFRDAVADPEVRTMADLCRALGLVPRGANYETLRSYASELRLPLDDRIRRLPAVRERRQPAARRSYTDDELLAAIERSDGYPALCEALGLSRRSATNRRLRERAAELGRPLPAEWSKPGRRSSASPATRRRRTQRRAGVDTSLALDPTHPDDVQGLRAAVAGAACRADAIRALGLPPSSTNYARLRRAIDRLGIDTSHFAPDAVRGGARARPLEELLVAGDRVVTGLRRRLLDEGLKEHRCEHCRLTTWRGAPIPLELDHVNGDRFDNRLENLRLLCPNCHALTPTYRGRNIGRPAAAARETTSPDAGALPFQPTLHVGS
jgi:hypothetical protein